MFYRHIVRHFSPISKVIYIVRSYIYSLINSTKPRSINHEINWTFLVVYCYGAFGIVRFCDMLFEVEVFENMFCSSLEYNEKKLNKQSQKTYTFESKKKHSREDLMHCAVWSIKMQVVCLHHLGFMFWHSFLHMSDWLSNSYSVSPNLLCLNSE